MAEKHEMEIEISPTGEVRVRVKGAKGKKCLSYVELFNSVGTVKSTEHTGEYYEPQPDVRITDDIRTKLSG